MFKINRLAKIRAILKRRDNSQGRGANMARIIWIIFMFKINGLAKIRATFAPRVKQL